MYKPTDFQFPDDPHRERVTLVVLELNSIMHQYFGFTKDPVAAVIVSAAVAHGCAIGRPFGVTTIADLTKLSRRKVYDVLDGLIEAGLFLKIRLDGVYHPVYVRNMQAPQQKKDVPDIYDAITRACRALCPEA